MKAGNKDYGKVLLAVGAGGALGSLARYAVAEAIPHQPGAFPLATLLVNVTGCLLIGVLMAALDAHQDPHPLARPFLGVGVLGGYTTFSTYAVDVLATGNAVAVLYAGATVVLALTATAAGHATTRAVLR